MFGLANLNEKCMNQDCFKYSYIESDFFTKQAKKSCLTFEEVESLQDYVAENLHKGIHLFKNVYKIRVPLGDSGTRGGGRVIYYYAEKINASDLYFLMFYAKAGKENLTTTEEVTLKEYASYIERENARN